MNPDTINNEDMPESQKATFDGCSLGLPRELQDDEQAAVLYSPFREKALNPRSWSRKMAFWQNFLTRVAAKSNIISFDSEALPNLYKRKGLSPKCLDAVIDALVKDGKLQCVSDFTQTAGWLAWGFNSLVKQPLSWTVTRLLGSGGSETKHNPAQYVWIHVVQSVCGFILDDHYKTCKNFVTRSVMSLSDFREKCSMYVTNNHDFSVILTHLQKDKKIAIKEMKDKTVLVKICEKNRLVVSDFTEADGHIFRIVAAFNQLERDIKSLTSTIESLWFEAWNYVQNNQRSLALHCLRKKKAAQRLLDRRSSMFIRVEAIVNQIEESKTNEMVISACQAGLVVMKAMNADLNVDHVEAVMDDVDECLEDAAQISAAVSAPGASKDLDIDAGLEEELEELLKETKSRPEQRSPISHKRFSSASPSPTRRTANAEPQEVAESGLCRTSLTNLRAVSRSPSARGRASPSLRKSRKSSTSPSKSKRLEAALILRKSQIKPREKTTPENPKSALKQTQSQTNKEVDAVVEQFSTWSVTDLMDELDLPDVPTHAPCHEAPPPGSTTTTRSQAPLPTDQPLPS